MAVQSTNGLAWDHTNQSSLLPSFSKRKSPIFCQCLSGPKKKTGGMYNQSLSFLPWTCVVVERLSPEKFSNTNYSDVHGTSWIRLQPLYK